MSVALRYARIVGVYSERGTNCILSGLRPHGSTWVFARASVRHARMSSRSSTRAVTPRSLQKSLESTEPEPHFHGDVALEASYRSWLHDCRPALGINPFAGGRWPAKELRAPELEALISSLLAPEGLLSKGGSVVLIGAGPDREKNLALARAISDQRVRVADTDASPLHLAALVHGLDFMVSSDSLAMHLAIAQGVPTVAFFAPTSAVEIDDFGRLLKVASTSADYCSYRKDADNSTITHCSIAASSGSAARAVARSRADRLAVRLLEG